MEDIKFSDFMPFELIGKTVLYQYGKSYNQNLNKALRKIEKVTSTGFRITKESGLFSLRDGYMKGLNGKMDAGTISKCELITEDKANELRKEWAENRTIKLFKDIISENINKISFTQLQSIVKIINPELLNQ